MNKTPRGSGRKEVQMDQFFAQFLALATLVGMLWVMGYGFAVMLKPIVSDAPQRYSRWTGRQGRALGRFALRQVQRFLLWTLRELWRLVRWGVPAIYRGIAGLL